MVPKIHDFPGVLLQLINLISVGWISNFESMVIFFWIVKTSLVYKFLGGSSCSVRTLFAIEVAYQLTPSAETHRCVPTSPSAETHKIWHPGRAIRWTIQGVGSKGALLSRKFELWKTSLPLSPLWDCNSGDIKAHEKTSHVIRSR